MPDDLSGCEAARVWRILDGAQLGAIAQVHHELYAEKDEENEEQGLCVLELTYCRGMCSSRPGFT